MRAEATARGAARRRRPSALPVDRAEAPLAAGVARGGDGRRLRRRARRDLPATMRRRRRVLLVGLGAAPDEAAAREAAARTRGTGWRMSRGLRSIAPGCRRRLRRRWPRAPGCAPGVADQLRSRPEPRGACARRRSICWSMSVAARRAGLGGARGRRLGGCHAGARSCRGAGQPADAQDLRRAAGTAARRRCRDQRSAARSTAPSGFRRPAGGGRRRRRTRRGSRSLRWPGSVRRAAGRLRGQGHHLRHRRHQHQAGRQDGGDARRHGGSRAPAPARC